MAKKKRKLGATLLSLLVAFLVYISVFCVLLITAALIFPSDMKVLPTWYSIILIVAPIALSIFSGFTFCKYYTTNKQNQSLAIPPKEGVDFVVPKSQKKQQELASKILSDIQFSADLCNNVTNVSLFVEYYDKALDGFSKLQLLPKANLKGYPSLDYYTLKDEFQLHLCDAIVRAENHTISEIHGKYKNSLEFQQRAAESFIHSIDACRCRFSPGTAVLADQSVAKVKYSAGLSNAFSNLPTEDIMANIDKMEGHEFEYYCANILSHIGYSNVEVTKGSGDQGIDILAQKDGIRYAIQCKCYSSPLGNTPIQEANTGKTMYNCQIAAVMTNSTFTQGGKECAQKTGVLLWDRSWMNTAIQKMNSHQ